MRLILQPGEVTLAELSGVYFDGTPAVLSKAAYPGVEKAAERIAGLANSELPTYGINTGFGKLASVRIPAADVATLQRNLILSHCCGVGAPLAPEIVRLIMTLKLISLGRGASGVRLELIHLIEAFLEKGVIPMIPEKGSVGASGDLAPLAHFAAVLMGEGEAFYDGERLSGAEALKRAGLAPITLGAKEGLALINGTQTSTALALAGLFRAMRALQSAILSGALATDAAMGSSAPFLEQIHTLRGHKGQIDVAASLRNLLSGSEIRESHRDEDTRVQDPYCIRCQPQVIGACLDLLRQAGHTLEIEANAATDNPLILDDGSAVSGGNFHAEPVAFAADQIAIAVSEIGAITQRRIALLVDPALSFGLPAFLAADPGLNSGFMIAEVTSAALMSENKQMTHPASVDSTPTSANQEDHVSMACHGARRLLQMTENLFTIVGIEMLAGTAGVEFRQPLATSKRLAALMSKVRATVPQLMKDRYMANDLAAARDLVSSGTLCAEVADLLPALEA